MWVTYSFMQNRIFYAFIFLIFVIYLSFVLCYL